MLTRVAAYVAVVFVALSAYATAQPVAPSATSRIAGAALREDVRILRRALDALHPGLYRYTTSTQLDQRFAALESHLAVGRTTAEAFLSIAEFTSTLQCGHTFPNPNNQSKAVAEAVFRHTPRVPFYFRWLGGTMVVTHDRSPDRAFPAGTEVVAINGTPTATILALLLPYARTDGANTAKRVANLGLNPSARWEAFDVYYPLVFPPPNGAWSFRVRAPGGLVRTIRAMPLDPSQRMAVYDSVRRVTRDTTSPPWQFRIDDGGIATMTMPTWVTFNDRWDWQGFIQRAFEQIAARGATTLVVDLRGNEGGTGVGDVILAHLVDREIVPNQLRRYTRYRTIPGELRPYLDTWDRSFDDWGAAAAATDAPASAGTTTGFFRLTRFDDDTAGGVIRPRAPRFRGRVFVLVGADNSSATFEFALAIREHKLGTLVGQPSGGNQRGINGGAFYFLRLPNSGIEVDLPLIGYFARDTRPDAGLDPDVPVRVTAEDIARGRDPEMSAVRLIVARPR